MYQFGIFRLLRLFRLFRWLAMGILALLLCVSLLLTAGTLWLRSTSGDNWLRNEAVGQLNTLMAASGLKISVEALEGPLPERLFVRGLVVEDAHGPWLTVEQAEVRLDLAALLEPAVLVPLLAVSDVRLERVPELPPSPPSDQKFPGDLLAWYPHWLRFVRVDAVQMERVSLPAALLGLPKEHEAVVISANGAVSVPRTDQAVSVPRADEIRSTLSIHRVGGVAEKIILEVVLHPTSGQLRLNLSFLEAEGGLVASLLKDSLQNSGVPLPTALELSLSGNAPLSNWEGELTFAAKGLVRTKGRVGVAYGAETVLRVNLETEAEPEAPQHWRTLGPVILLAETRLEPNAVAVPSLSLTLAAGSLTAEQVRVGLNETNEAGETGALRGTVRLNVTQPQDILSIVREQAVSLAAAEIKLTVAGTLKAPNLHLQAEVREVRGPDMRMESATAEFRLTGSLHKPEARLRLHSPAVSASGNTFQNIEATVNVFGESVNLDEPLTSVARAELAVAVTTPHGPARLQAEVALREARLALSKIQLTGLGVGLEGGIALPLSGVLAASGSLTARVNDWAALSALLPVPARADKAELRLALNPENGQSAELGWTISGLQIPFQKADSSDTVDSTSVAVSSLSGSLKGRNLLALPHLELAVQVGEGSADKAQWKGAVVAFSGDAARQTANFSASLDSLVYGRVGAAFPIMASLTGSLANQKTLACVLSVSGLGLEGMEGRVNLPVRFVDGLPDIPADGPLSGELRWKGALASVWRLVPLANTRVRGDAVVDVKLGGTVGNPRPSGIIRLDKMLFQDLGQAFEVSNIMAEITLLANGSGKARVEGTDGRKGTFQFSGSVGTAADGFPLDIQGSLNQLMPLQRRDVRVSLSGTAKVTGTPVAPDVFADITVNSGEVLLEQLPSGGIDTLTVVEGVTSPTFQNPSSEAANQPLPAVGKLNVTVTVPNRFYVRGHGIESEWQGQLRVNGPLTNPAVGGELSSMRGTLAFLGKNFVLKRGSVAFDGGTPPRPLLDIQLGYTQQNFTALITLSGPATRPHLNLSSQPSMPTDEIVAQILFGKSTGGLARGEALQLAATVASLTVFGQGGGLMDFTRSTLGLDVLRVGSSRPGGSFSGSSSSTFDTPGSQSINPSDASEDDVTLEVGKYVLDNVYVGLEQGMDSRSTGVVVDIEVSPNLNIEARTTGKGSDVEATWSWDY